jgi:hypothetical protein
VLTEEILWYILVLEQVFFMVFTGLGNRCEKTVR